MTPPVVLTIAGSDSSGGAGIQADLLTFAALGAYGASVITAVTAQNTTGVTAIHPVPADMVAAQLDAVLGDLRVAAVKVGMVGDPAVAEVIADRASRLPNLVVDPVLAATSGAQLGSLAAVARLVAYPCVLTPNRQEADALLRYLVQPPLRLVGAEGDEPETVEQMAAGLGGFGPRAVVVTGSEQAVDVLWHDDATTVLPGQVVATANTHGTGCTFSSAIAARLALGDSVPAAVRAAKAYVTRALRSGTRWRLGAGPGPLGHFGNDRFAPIGEEKA